MTIQITLAIIIKLFMWLLIIVTGLFVYRKFQLPSLLWMGGYLVASIISSVATPLLFSGMLGLHTGHPMRGESFFKDIMPNINANMPDYTILNNIFAWSGLFASIANLLIAVLLIADIVYLVSKFTNHEAPSILLYVLKIRNQANILGMLIIFITLCTPIVTILLSFISS